MRKVLLSILLTPVAACALPETRWVKDGADDKAVAEDLKTCRRAAQIEAMREADAFPPAPYWGPPWPPWNPPFYYGSAAWPRTDRFYLENRLSDFCMRNKGYELVTLPPAPKATTPEAAPQR